MPQIVPIKELKNTNRISQMCHESQEPIYVTKNGYGDMVIMSMEAYERQMVLAEVEAKLAAAEEQVASGNVLDAKQAFAALREKSDLVGGRKANRMALLQPSGKREKVLQDLPHVERRRTPRCNRPGNQ